MIYGEEVDEDGVLRDEIIETITQAVFEKINEFVNNNLKAHRFRSDVELDGIGLLYGINEVVRVGDNFIMLRNGMTVCALVIDFEMPEFDTLIDVGIPCIWIDCTGNTTDFISRLNSSWVDAQEVRHSISCGIFDNVVTRRPHDQTGPFDF